jgi:hypothetical protein
MPAVRLVVPTNGNEESKTNMETVMSVHRLVWRGVAAVSVLAAVVLGAASGAAAQPPQSGTAACIPFIAITPAFAQHRDMALGLPNGPLADRDSSGISFAESWREIPASASDTSIRLVNRLIVDGVEAAASVNFGGLPADAVISEPKSSADRWLKETVNGFVRYRNVLNGKYITYVPGDQTAPFRARTSGTDGQLFKLRVLGC